LPTDRSFAWHTSGAPRRCGSTDLRRGASTACLTVYSVPSMATLYWGQHKRRCTHRLMNIPFKTIDVAMCLQILPCSFGQQQLAFDPDPRGSRAPCSWGSGVNGFSFHLLRSVTSCRSASCVFFAEHAIMHVYVSQWYVSWLCSSLTVFRTCFTVL
jgi:hypothetical protein